MSVDTLTTMEQVEASTDDSKAVGAGAVKELSSSLANIKMLEIYSTEETVIGKWIDGSTIYRKVIHIPSTVEISATNPSVITSDDFIQMNTIINSIGLRIGAGYPDANNYLIAIKQDDYNKIGFISSSYGIGGFSKCNYIILEYTKYN